MPDQTIKCPNCGLKIELTEVLTGAIRDKLRAEVEAEYNPSKERIQEPNYWLDREVRKLKPCL